MQTQPESSLNASRDGAHQSSHSTRAAAQCTVLALVTMALMLPLRAAAAESRLTPADNAFLQAADQRGMAEVALSDLAAQKGMRDEVKALGQLIANERTLANADLKAFAVKAALTLPEGLELEWRIVVHDMAALKDKEFDDAYLAAMTKQLVEDLRAFTSEAADAQDPELKYILEKSLRVLTEHAKAITALTQ